MRSGSGYSAEPSIAQAGAGLRGDGASGWPSLHIMRYVAATEWVLHIADVKELSAKRLARLNGLKQPPRLGPCDLCQEESTSGWNWV